MTIKHHGSARPGRLADTPIAIVGMAGLFPKSAALQQFWQNVVEGTDCIEPVPASRWSVDDYFDADPEAEDKTYCGVGGFIPDVEFSPVEFGIPPNQLEVTSTLQTLSLGVARDLLHDAGAEGDWYAPERTGVVLGVTGPVPLMHPLAARLSTPILKEVVRSCGLTKEDAEEISSRYVKAFTPWQENAFPGLLANVVAGRVANRLGLGGMNCTVDAACAASLSALRVAVSELVDGRADMMITGGCDTENSIFIYMCFSKTQALSRNGRIRPFDRSADGTLLGEGIGMLALRRLSDARRDGNRVYAVIRGIGSSSDGRSKSIYTPREEGQRVALDRAYEDAACSPASIGLIEAHATGTAVGDRTELVALEGLLTAAGAEPRSVGVGSVKSQIGHTKGAAGTASVIKLVFALDQRLLPPTINVDDPNPGIDFTRSPLYVSTTTRPWVIDPDRPRRASASAMGFGGTNFHVVLEEPERDAPSPVLHRTAHAHLWHAPTVDGLVELLRSGVPSSNGGPVPDDHARVGFAAVDTDAFEELRELSATTLAAGPGQDEWWHPSGVAYRRRAMPDLKVAALFSGQGSQYLDMGLRAALANPPVLDAFDAAATCFGGAGHKLGSVVFPPPVFDADLRQAQEALLRRTEYAQPALGALSAGQYAFLRELGLECQAALGHSFGELTALWATGCVHTDDLFRLARARGLAMATTGAGKDPGAMAAVEAGIDDVLDLLEKFPDVVVCNYNAPDQIVVGGGTDDVEALVEICTERELTARRLAVSAAFHTRYVADAVEAFRTCVDGVVIGAPRYALYANSPGATYGFDVAVNRAVLTDQLMRPVEFRAGLEAMRADGCNVFVEFGPKQVLTRLVHRTLGDSVVAIPTDAGPLGDGDLALKSAAVRLAVLGAPIEAVNRFDAVPPAPRPGPQGATVVLQAAEYVPESRAESYRSALRRPWHPGAPLAATAESAPAGPAARAVPAVAAELSAPFAGPTAPAPAIGSVVDDAIERHVALHSRYLDGQMEVAEALLAAAAPGADGARPSPDALETVKNHSVAVSQAHAKANDILATLAQLEFDESAGATTAFPSPGRTGDPARRETLAPPPVPTVEATAFRSPVAIAPAPAAKPVAAGPVPATELPPHATDGLAVPAVVLEIVADRTGYPVEVLGFSMDLEADLGIDSIKRVQILGALQQRFPQVPSVGPEQLAEMRTLAHVVDHLESFLGTSGTPEHGDGDVLTPVGPPVPPDATRTPFRMVELPTVDRLVDPFTTEPVAVLVGRRGDDAERIASALESTGWSVRHVPTPPPDGEQVHDLVAGAVGPDTVVDLCVVLLVDTGAWEDNVGQLGDAVLAARAVQPALQARLRQGKRAAFVAVTRLDGRGGATGACASRAAVLGGAGGLVKTLAREAPDLYCRTVDVAADMDDDAFSGAFLDELHDAATDTLETAVDVDGRRWTPYPVPYRPSALRPGSVPAVDGATDDGRVAPVGADDVIVVTGGARGVTALCVRALAAKVPAEFLLLGTTEEGAEPAWAHGVANPELRAAAALALKAERPGEPVTPRQLESMCLAVARGREIRATVDAVAAAGGRARYLRTDVTDARAVEAALGALRERVTALVHGAGALADAMIVDKKADDVRRVIAPKLAGLGNLLVTLADSPLRHVVLFGSVAGLFGNVGQADYATANEAFGRLAPSLRRERPGCAVTSIDWGAWDGGMVTPELRTIFVERGVQLLDPVAGAARFVEQLTAPLASDARVVVGDPSALTEVSQHGGLRSLSAARDLAPLEHDEIIQAHRIGPFPVLPASFAMGWMINVVERAHPGLCVVGLSDFEVVRGVVFDGRLADRYAVDVTGSGEASTVRVTVHSGSDGAFRVTHYGARLRLAPGPDGRTAEPGWPGYELGRGPEDGLQIYAQGTQFHGPRLQGIRRILDRADGRAAFECRLTDGVVARGAYAGALYSPVLADVMLQCPPVLGKWLDGRPCLPMGVGQVDLYAALPSDEPFVVVLDRVATKAAETTMTATAFDRDGNVLQRMGEVAVVTTPDLATRFAESLAYWQAEVVGAR